MGPFRKQPQGEVLPAHATRTRSTPRPSRELESVHTCRRWRPRAGLTRHHMRRIQGIRRVFRHEGGTDVDVEMQFHIDTRTDDLVASGMDQQEARRVALAEFGDVNRYENET